MDIKKEYERWLENATADANVAAELKTLDNAKIEDAFYRDLAFGTGGLRGVIGAGTNRMNGLPVFIDPGTYIYHCDIESRNAYRKTENHNTVCINGRDQSEMLGAFLWGKRAESQLISHSNAQGKIELTASHDGYSPAKHIRKYEFDGESVYNEIQLNPCEINTETISEYMELILKPQMTR